MKLPEWVENDNEMIIWSPLLTDPPMATYREVTDGTYSIDDLLQMVLLIKYKSSMKETN